MVSIYIYKLFNLLYKWIIFCQGVVYIIVHLWWQGSFFVKGHLSILPTINVHIYRTRCDMHCKISNMIVIWRSRYYSNVAFNLFRAEKTLLQWQVEMICFNAGFEKWKIRILMAYQIFIKIFHDQFWFKVRNYSLHARISQMLFDMCFITKIVRRCTSMYKYFLIWKSFQIHV